MSAISGIEQALWDIKGKYYHMPIYEMLGGACRDRVRMYGHLKPAAIAGDFPVEEMLKIADQRLAEGFTAVKYSVIPPIRPLDNLEMLHAIVDRFAAVRQRVGSKVDIAVDFHGRVSSSMSIRVLKELEPYYPLFVEEPVLPGKHRRNGACCTQHVHPHCSRRAAVRALWLPQADRAAGSVCSPAGPVPLRRHF